MVRCTFCGATEEEADVICTLPHVAICDKCVKLCQDTIDEQRAKDREDLKARGLLSPDEC